jgi:hypothetical protein
MDKINFLIIYIMKQICIGNKCIPLQTLKHHLGKYTSDDELKMYLGNDVKIVKYQHLDDYYDVKQLLPKNKSFIIILIEWEFNVGHWVLLSRYEDNGMKILEYFNSYGSYPSSELELLSIDKRKELDECEKHLNILLRKSMNEFTIIYNKYPMQSLRKVRGIIPATCGLHCIVKSIMLTKYNLNLEQYITFMKNLKKQTKLTYDEIVVILFFSK